MTLPRSDPDACHDDRDDEDRYEPLWGVATAVPPALLLCGVVLLALAALA